MSSEHCIISRSNVNVLCRKTIVDETTGRRFTAGGSYQLDSETTQRLQKSHSGAFVVVERRIPRRDKMVHFPEKIG